MKGRLVFVDLLRGWATIVMIEVHVFNAFIVPSLKETNWYNLLNYINGLVAPTFIFVAGFVFVYVSERKIEDFRSYGRLFWRQIYRIAQIWIIGYLLHLPFFSWSRMLHESSQEDWLKFYQSDVLNCIAAGLLFLFIARVKIRSNDTYRRFLIVAGFVTAFITPFIWEIDFNKYIPAQIGAYLNGQHFSGFPLFLWIAFMMAGGYYAMDFLKAKQANDIRGFLRRIGVTGVVMSVGGRLATSLPAYIPSASANIRANPFFFFERLGIVLLLLAVCWYYAEWRKTEQSFVLDASKESLSIYAAHLMVIYGMFYFDMSLAYLYGGKLSILACCAATVVLTAVMILAAKVWSWLKQRHVYLARGIATMGAVIFFSYFFSR
ncbi:MAG TPA: acyltransferase family protein [Bacteroidota bacterium]